MALQRQHGNTTDVMESENHCRHNKITKSRSSNPVEWRKERHKQGRTDNEHMRGGPKQTKATTTTQMGRTHGKGRHRDRVIYGPEN